MYNGTIINSLKNDDDPSNWIFDNETVKIINCLWQICKSGSDSWNESVSALNEMEKYRSINNSETEICIFYSSASQEISGYQSKFKKMHRLLKSLQLNGLINNLTIRNDSIKYKYSSKKIRQCVLKAGNILEIKILSIVRRMQNSDGTPYFNDSKNGVSIRWNDYSQDNSQKVLSVNEIDILAMKGLIPVFISCKNGMVDYDELYKLNAVAFRFGGLYSKKILIATDTGKNEISQQSFARRAKDMGIVYIDDAFSKDDIKLISCIKHCTPSL